jgi:thymidylate synthase
VEKILENPQYPAPKFWINPEVKNFYDFTVDDFKLEGYEYTKLEDKIEVAI